MSFVSRDVKDRIIQYPRRYQLTPVGGTDDTYDLVPITGTITEEGTKINKAYLQPIEDGIVGAMPQGGIIMWSGLISNIPSNWALCDGTNGTPNLTDRFIMGAITDATINKTGGQNAVTLTVEQMPSHGHSGSTASAGSHSHTIDIARSGENGASAISSTRFKVDNVNSATSSAGDHIHNLSIENTGSGQAHENRPAYYTLAFIMKV